MALDSSSSGVRWMQRFDGRGTFDAVDDPTALGFDGANVVVAAGFDGSTTIGGTTLTVPTSGVYLAHLDPTGALIDAASVASDVGSPVVTGLGASASGTLISTAPVSTTTDVNTGLPTSVTRFSLVRVHTDLGFDWTWTSSEAEDVRHVPMAGRLASLDGETAAVAGSFTRAISIGDASVTSGSGAPHAQSIFLGEITVDR